MNWIVDGNFSLFNLTGYPGCAGCELHGGFLLAYNSLSAQMYNALKAYGASSAPYIWTTGHSLGAAISEIATFELLLAGYPVALAINMGDPRIGNPTWAAAYASLVGEGRTDGIRLNAAAVKAGASVSALLHHAVRRAATSTTTGASASRHELQQSVLAALRNQEASGMNVNTRGGRHAAMAAAMLSVRESIAANLAFAPVHPVAAGGISTYRLIHWQDPVPQLPLQQWGYKHAPQEVFYNAQSSSYKVCSATNGEDPTCSDGQMDLNPDDHGVYLNVTMSGTC